MTLKSKGKEKILIEEEFEIEKEEVIDAALEEAISRATMTEESKRSLREIIASITTEQSTTTTPTPAAVKKTPTKSPVSIPRASDKRKNAQPSKGAATVQALE